MSADRVQRLKKLLRVQNQMKALHETRHAAHLAAAENARQESVDLAARFDTDATMPTLFPEVYHRRISDAVSREAGSREAAARAAAEVAVSTRRRDRAADHYREARADHERHAQDRERLERVTRPSPERK